LQFEQLKKELNLSVVDIRIHATDATIGGEIGS
jgi:hypothetical protein